MHESILKIIQRGRFITRRIPHVFATVLILSAINLSYYRKIWYFDRQTWYSEFPDISVALCAICKYEDKYIEEYIDYYMGLGFDHIYLYDNSDEFTLEPLVHNNTHVHNVTLFQYPGEKKQIPAYHDCIQRALDDKYTWAAFFDVDEFLVLKKHPNIRSFVKEYGSHGGIVVNWAMFSPSNETVYKPVPVTKRFQYRYPGLNQHVKSIVRLEDGPEFYDPHNPIRFSNYSSFSIDTRGEEIAGPFNFNGTEDVAVLHHYHFKSKEEFINKRMRGRSDLVLDTTESERMDDAKNEYSRVIADTNQFYDDSAWKVLKRRNPWYNVFDSKKESAGA